MLLGNEKINHELNVGIGSLICCYIIRSLSRRSINKTGRRRDGLPGSWGRPLVRPIATLASPINIIIQQLSLLKATEIIS